MRVLADPNAHTGLCNTFVLFPPYEEPEELPPLAHSLPVRADVAADGLFPYSEQPTPEGAPRQTLALTHGRVAGVLSIVRIFDWAYIVHKYILRLEKIQNARRVQPSVLIAHSVEHRSLQQSNLRFSTVSRIVPEYIRH